MHESRYEVLSSTSVAVTIRDVGHDRGCRTVTNDAERVVGDLHRRSLLGTRRLFYYDSFGMLDEIVHDDQGRFTAFRPGPRKQEGAP